MHTPLWQGSRTAAAVTWALAAPVFIGVAGPAAAASGSSLVSLDVREARLADVVTMLTQKTGINNIVLAPASAGGFGSVTLTLSEQPVDKALRAVAAAAGATVMEEDGIYYVRPRGAETGAAPPPAATVDVADAVVVPPAPPAAAPTPDAAAPAPAITAPIPSRPIGPKQWVKITLQHLKPSHFVNLLRNPDFLTQDDGPVPEMRLRDGVRVRPMTPPPAPIVVPSGNGGDGPAAPGGFAAGRSDAPDAAAGQRTFPRPGGGTFQGQPGGVGVPGGVGGAPGGVGGVGGAGGLQGGQATNLLPEGVDPPLAYDVDNSLLVRGDPEGLEQLRDIIRLLDIPPRQVLIKAEFVDVRIDDLEDFGIVWNIRAAGNVALGTQALGSAGSLNLIYASGNAVANLRATATRNTTNVLQSPIISTINNVPASIEVSETIPVFTTNTIFNNNIAQNVTTVQTVDVINGLQVQPRINGDNSITLFVQPQLQNATFITGPGGQVAPQVSTRALTTYRRIQNGETMVLGGFISRQDTRQSNRVPFLGDLPIIGSLFRSRSRTATGSEVLVFLTPNIIEDRSTGTLGTGGGAPPPTP